MILCSNCRRPYPETGAPYRCPVCRGLYDYNVFPDFDPGQVDLSAPGIWRYRTMLGLPAHAPEVSLGEGNTPLVWSQAFGKRVAFKLESLNPSGSFKDRGSASLVSFLCSRGANAAVEDSSGNAGASFAAYAARAGISASIYIPASASGPKRSQIEAYGAEIIPIPGPRSNAAEAVRKAAESGAIYASHAYLPFNLPGYATMAYEIFAQLGEVPGTLVLPAGQGGLLLGAARGFEALMKARLIEKIPHLVGVQALACAPLWAFSRYGYSAFSWVTEGETLAEGVRVFRPLRGDAVIQAVETSGGEFLSIPEEQILPGRDQLARLGFYVEPTSALVWDALSQGIDRFPEPIVVVLTGSGLKYAG